MIHCSALVYIAGAQSIDSLPNATLWVTSPAGNVIQSYSLAEEESAAFGSITKGAFTYVVGYEQTDVETATLWIRNIQGEYVNKIYLEQSFVEYRALMTSSKAYSIISQGQYLYICGEYNSSAVLWRVKEGDYSIERFTLTRDAGLAESMTFLDNKIYIAGFDSGNITFWVFDTIDNTSIVELPL